MPVSRLRDDVVPRPIFTRPWFVLSGIVVVFLLLISLFVFKVETVAGNEMGVLETWTGGVQSTPLMPKTYFFFPGFLYHVYKYDMSAQVYVMNDKPMHEEQVAEGREKDTYRIESRDQQPVTLSMNMRWRRDPSMLIAFHKMVREQPEEKILRPAILRNVKDEATIKNATEIYSGPGLVELQDAIDKRLTDPAHDIAKHGIIVENFVVEKIDLDPKYVEEISARQISMQSELRAVQQEKTAQAEAKKAKAEAQADYERKVVEAERDKKVGVLAAEKAGETAVIAAKADAQKVVVAAQAEKDAMLNIAQAIIAKGKAVAEAKTLELSAYGAPGAENYVRIQVATSMGEAFKGIQGYLPADMKVNVLSGSFMDALNAFISKHPEPAATTMFPPPAK